MMSSIRDMINANEVITKLAANTNIYVSSAFKLLPIMEFVTEVVDSYLKAKEEIIAKDISLEEKEKEFNEYLDKEIKIPDIKIGVNTLRNCNLTMIDLQHIHWWLVEFEDEYED